MTTTPRAAFGLLMLTGLAACSTLRGGDSGAGEIPLFVGAPLASYQVTIATPENRQTLSGVSTTVPKLPNSKFPNSSTSVSVASKDVANDALTLTWRDTWYAGLKIDGGAPLNLTPYIRQGTVEFDLKVNELSKGDIAFSMGCGNSCERKVSYMVPARAAIGKGWQHVALGLTCFARDSDDFSAINEPIALVGSGSGEVSIANIVIRPNGSPNTACPDYKTVSVTPAMQNEAWSVGWWLPRHEAKLEEVRALKAKGVNSELIFIGDSITHGWENAGAKVWERDYRRYKALDLGFSGDRTENVLWRLLHGEVDGINPKLAVLMFGTNNTGQRQEAPATTAAGIKRNIDELRKRLPNTKILLLAIFPREESPNGKQRQTNEQVNALISRYADNQHVFFLNINHAFLQADGTLSKDIMPDLLHPNEKGYQIWADAMRPKLERLLQQ
ncbi:GDSL-type esterase/lipase family protein [Pseudoduganella sp. LjRoot289]|uniref:GDSL-type esterase/lipase family protein n=1 Tax=Pseudoduganella sp. LjRoot289 TaxID=3342314 RepID=UPI003ECF5FA6